LPETQVVVAQRDLDRLHDRIYALEAALDDVEGDIADAGIRVTHRPRDSGAGPYADAFLHLREAAEDLRGFVLEPVST